MILPDYFRGKVPEECGPGDFACWGGEEKCSTVSFWELWNDVFLSPHSLGADHELPLELDKSAVGLERGEGVGQGGVFFFIFLSFQKKVRAWAEKKGATDFAAVGELAKMI